jgi:hypothetical protein
MGKGYPGYVLTKNQKSNFRRQSKAYYCVDNGTLLNKKTFGKFIFDLKERKEIIQMIHKGTNDSNEATALSSHRGRVC